jgi:hypothetical protein
VVYRIIIIILRTCGVFALGMKGGTLCHYAKEESFIAIHIVLTDISPSTYCMCILGTNGFTYEENFHRFHGYLLPSLSLVTKR